VRITVDTNILVRAAIHDEPQQSRVAARVLHDAETIAITVPALCEFVWVLSRGYKRTIADIVSSIRHLIDSASVVVDRPVVDAGLAVLEAGGDFADGVIAFEGRRLGGDIFVSFDRHAVSLVRAGGGEARLLSGASRPH